MATLVAGETLMRLEGRVGLSKHICIECHAGSKLRTALGKGRKGIQHSSRLVPWYTHLRPPSAPVRAQKKAWVDEAEGGLSTHHFPKVAVDWKTGLQNKQQTMHD